MIWVSGIPPRERTALSCMDGPWAARTQLWVTTVKCEETIDLMWHGQGRGDCYAGWLVPLVTIVITVCCYQPYALLFNVFPRSILLSEWVASSSVISHLANNVVSAATHRSDRIDIVD